MRQTKFQLKDIQGMLSRDEMRKIMGGDDGAGGCLKSGSQCDQQDSKCCKGLICSGCSDTGYECSKASVVICD
ncbi:hypothetical protein SAMN05421788_110123 [Filimonas lacunae]|uniref:Uncharacterized protein n=1 Tax=Filimonas lacunae TaxID=477680 RepID=A0A1N7R804_9BACT|nr:hypothetical protein [Filimonas lacunae]SIT31278.1 hypothetical protein SAMN05421788_110123 [Filimonas lacunae]